MPRVPPFDREATYEDLARLPDLYVAEIVGGELHASPRPALRHVDVSSSLGMVLGPPFQQGRGGPGGWRILDEPELHFGRDVLVPDLAGWRRARLPTVPDTAYTSIVPDWLCEILSPSTAAFDRTNKLGVYAREGVPSAWIIDPQARTLEVLRLESGGWTIVASHTGNDVVRAEPFADIGLDLGSLWGGL